MVGKLVSNLLDCSIFKKVNAKITPIKKPPTSIAKDTPKSAPF